MKSRNKAIWLSSFLLLAGLTYAQAEIVVGDSLDWLVVSHDHILGH